jgi:hypothetical protein
VSITARLPAADGAVVLQALRAATGDCEHPHRPTPPTPTATTSRLNNKRGRTALAARSSAGEEWQEFGEELAGMLEVRDVTAVGYHHSRGAGNVVGGRRG